MRPHVLKYSGPGIVWFFVEIHVLRFEPEESVRRLTQNGRELSASEYLIGFILIHGDLFDDV